MSLPAVRSIIVAEAGGHRSIAIERNKGIGVV